MFLSFGLSTRKRNILIRLRGVIFQIKIKDSKKKEKQYPFRVFYLQEKISGSEQMNLLPLKILNSILEGFIFLTGDFTGKGYISEMVSGATEFILCAV